jgi:diguanylate cyclase (GGDEF)-like protein
MVDKWVKKYSIGDKKLSYQFRIFSLLLLLIPTAVFFYIISNLASVSDLLQSKYLIPFIFSIIITLCVLALLQGIFSHLSTIASAMKEGPERLLEELKEIQGAYELRGIADSFEALLEKYQKTSSDLQRRALELLLIKELAEETSSNLDMNMLLNVLLDKVIQVTRAKIGSVFLIDEDGENFHIIGSRGSESNAIIGTTISIKDSIARHIMEGGTEPILVDDIETDHRFRKKNDPKYGSPSFLSMPVRCGDKLIAVLNLAHKENGERFQQEDVDLASIMIQEVGFALENACIHSEIKRHAERLEQQTDILRDEIHRRKLAEKELEHLAHRDTLTGLSNRYMFIDRLEVAVAQARRNSTKLAVMFVDLDRFKSINDTLGHTAGDEVLREVARRMKTCLREVDLIARYGGDEFTITLIDVTDTKGVDRVANKIIDTLQQPIELKEGTFSIGCSIGISIYPDDSEDFEGLIKHADIAMYTSKENKESCFRYYTPAMTETS